MDDHSDDLSNKMLSKTGAASLTSHGAFTRISPALPFTSQRAIRKNAYKPEEHNSKIKQEAIYGIDGYIAHECLLRPRAEDGEVFYVKELADEAYERGAHFYFDLLTSSVGMKGAVDFPITLNISVKSTLSKKFMADVKERMPRNSLEPQDIIFEILEHDVEREDNIDHLMAMKEDGFRFALDDLAIGESHENRLHVFGDLVDYIKIDGPLVRAYFEGRFEEKDDNGNVIATYDRSDFINLLNALKEQHPNQTLVAERVYNKSEVAALYALGIDGFQGQDLDPNIFPYTSKTKPLEANGNAWDCE